MLRSLSFRVAVTDLPEQERAAPPVADWGVETVSRASPPERSLPTGPADEELLLRLRGGDAAALETLYDRYARLFMGIGLRILGNRGEAEEIVQEVFLYIYTKAALYDPARGPVNKWIAQVAYHRALDRRDYLRRRGFYAGTGTISQADTLLGETDLDREIGTKLSCARLEQSFAVLPERQRQTLELFYFQGMDFHEIGEKLEEPVSNVRHHYYRGLEKLRKSAFVRKMREK